MSEIEIYKNYFWAYMIWQRILMDDHQLEYSSVISRKSVNPGWSFLESIYCKLIVTFPVQKKWGQVPCKGVFGFFGLQGRHKGDIKYLLSTFRIFQLMNFLRKLVLRARNFPKRFPNIENISYQHVLIYIFLSLLLSLSCCN